VTIKITAVVVVVVVVVFGSTDNQITLLSPLSVVKKSIDL
jgi:hypothetical protein